MEAYIIVPLVKLNLRFYFYLDLYSRSYFAHFKVRYLISKIFRVGFEVVLDLK